MRDQLMRYVDLLFAGSPQSGEIKQEILQNTLDHYDDLVAQGKSPEAAYSLAIAGIGDVSELLNGGTPVQPVQRMAQPQQQTVVRTAVSVTRKIVGGVMLGLSILLYIISPIPMLLIQNEIGLCAMLAIIAVATAFMVIQKILRGGDRQREVREDSKSKAQKGVDSALWCVIAALYFVLSYLTMAWHITWVVFIIGAALQGVVNAIFDLKEVK